MKKSLFSIVGLIILGFGATMLSNESFATSEGSRPRCSNDRILSEIREKLINEAIKLTIHQFPRVRLTA
jgi:hypothetical protein